MITKENIKKVLNHNKLSGVIETGLKHWITDFKTAPYTESHNLNHTARYINQINDYFFNTTAICDNSQQLNKEIDILTEKIYNHYLNEENARA